MIKKGSSTFYNRVKTFKSVVTLEGSFDYCHLQFDFDFIYFDLFLCGSRIEFLSLMGVNFIGI